MNLSLVGKRALVCGSSAGIGRACAVELAALGASVTLMARDAAKLAAVRDSLAGAGGGAAGDHAVAVADFQRVDEVQSAAKRAIEAHGPHHIVIHNTGGPAAGPALDASVEQYAQAFAMHLLTGQVLVQAAVPGMKSAGYGRVVNIISTSVKQPIAGLGVSNAVRGAVAQWAKTLAGELGPFGITVNNVLPGYTRTERLTSLVRGRASKGNVSEADVERDLLSSIPAGRFGEAKEIASAVAFLCSPAAGYVNGVNLPVDGGRLGGL
ncbi:MAG: SDR family oxidoreductase [Phycisphaerales bacterium]|jgi:3-oxoacyl-[acyl-carrier protein] reductase